MNNIQRKDDSMKGYVVIDTEVVDQEAFSEFVERIPGAMTANGGRFVVRGGQSQVAEGDWTPQRLVIMEFESYEAASAFIASDEYAALDELRHRAVKSRVVVVEGYSSDA